MYTPLWNWDPRFTCRSLGTSNSFPNYSIWTRPSERGDSHGNKTWFVIEATWDDPVDLSPDSSYRIQNTPHEDFQHTLCMSKLPHCTEGISWSPRPCPIIEPTQFKKIQAMSDPITKKVTSLSFFGTPRNLEKCSSRLLAGSKSSTQVNKDFSDGIG